MYLQGNSTEDLGISPEHIYQGQKNKNWDKENTLNHKSPRTKENPTTSTETSQGDWFPRKGYDGYVVVLENNEVPLYSLN